MAGKIETFLKEAKDKDSSAFFLEKALENLDKTTFNNIVTDEIDFLTECSEADSLYIFNFKQRLALKVMSKWSERNLAKKLKFLIRCQKGEPEVKKISEELALRIYPEDLAKEVEFLVESCNSGAGVYVQILSETLALKIKPKDLFKKIEYLIRRQEFDGTDIFRNISRQLALKVCPKDLLKKLKFLIKCRLSECSNILNLSEELVLKINRRKLREELRCLIDDKELGKLVVIIEKMLDSQEKPKREIKKIISFLIS